jgi:hypothetical protein
VVGKTNQMPTYRHLPIYRHFELEFLGESSAVSTKGSGFFALPRLCARLIMRRVEDEVRSTTAEV